MVAAPKYKCYDLKFIKGSGTHSGNHGEAFYPILLYRFGVMRNNTIIIHLK
jgi:hypothetical protein